MHRTALVVLFLSSGLCAMAGGQTSEIVLPQEWITGSGTFVGNTMMLSVDDKEIEQTFFGK